MSKLKVAHAWRYLVTMREKHPDGRWRLDLVKVTGGVAAVTNGGAVGWLPVPLPDGLYLASSEPYVGEANWPDLAAKVGRPPTLKREGDRLAPAREALAATAQHAANVKAWRTWHRRASAALGTEVYETSTDDVLPLPIGAAQWYAANPRPLRLGAIPSDSVWLPALEVELDQALLGPALALVESETGEVKVGRWSRKGLVGLWLRSAAVDRLEALVIGMQRTCPACSEDFAGATCGGCGKKREEVMS